MVFWQTKEYIFSKLLMATKIQKQQKERKKKQKNMGLC